MRVTYGDFGVIRKVSGFVVVVMRNGGQMRPRPINADADQPRRTEMKT